MNRINFHLTLLVCYVALLSACGTSSEPAGSAASASCGVDGSSSVPGRRPNVVIILADDLGYSDLSAFGSEISTPNIDALAREGQILSNFHSTPLCATSRADLLAGVDHHLVGMATLPESSVLYPPTATNYRGNLNHNAPTIAQLLRDAGYHTYMAGKWHLGAGGPVEFGFEQSFSLKYDAAFASNFAPDAQSRDPGAQPYFENGVQLSQLPSNFFSTDYFVDKLEQYIGQDHGDGKPFFVYLPFQAVHFPLQAPQRYLNLYEGRYDAGYAVNRAARIQREKALGIIPQDFVPNPGDEVEMTRFGQPGVLTNKPWEALTPEQQRSEARIMEVFAAMLTDLDDNVGRLIAYLKQIGEYDNTVIIFLSDNGADGEGYGFIPYVDSALNLDTDNSLANYGRPASFIFRSGRWAEVGNAPFRLFKGFTAEGGISVPAIVRLPDHAALLPSAAFSTLRDIEPTLLALTGVQSPGDEYQGGPSLPIDGSSLLPVLDGQSNQVHDSAQVFVDEVDDIRFVRQGPWKLTRVVNYLVPSSGLNLNHDWQLYNMDSDRGETTDLAAVYPQRVDQMIQDWSDYVDRVGVVNPILPPLLPPIHQ